MQDCLALQAEILHIAELNICDGVQIISSEEDWNPIAAVLLKGFNLPPSINPSMIDLRIPIPDLYGFTTSASVLLTDEMLLERTDEHGLSQVPFCRSLQREDIQDHENYFVDLREQREWAPEMFYLCITPIDQTSAKGFKHISLYQFTNYLLDYLASPRATLLSDLDFSMNQWQQTNDGWWLLRIGHIYEGLNEIGKARDAFLLGENLFPSQKEFSLKLRRLDRT